MIFGTGSFLITVGNFNLHPQYIKMPEAEEEIRKVRQGFYNIATLPRCIGSLNCTHVKIQGLGGNQAEISRKLKTIFFYQCSNNLWA